MASSFASIRLLLLFSLLGLSAIGARARPGIHFHPCRTFFISYTMSSSFKPLLQTPHLPDSSDHNPSGFFAIYREFNEFHPKPLYPSSQIFADHPDFPRPLHLFLSSSSSSITEQRQQRQQPHMAEFPRSAHFLGSFGVSSLRERTKDILSVVLALLFGVGCGALTSATMYLVWSVITSGHDSQEALSGEESDEESPKDMGYVKIPTAPEKEGHEGN